MGLQTFFFSFCHIVFDIYLSAMSAFEFGVALCDVLSNERSPLLFATYFNLTPRFSRNSEISAVPCIRRFTPRGKPRHDDKLIEFKYRQLLNISLTASNETDEPHKFK